MLALLGTRQKMIIQAFKQWGINKKLCCPKIAAVCKCINQQQMISIAANLTTGIKYKMMETKLQ
jgi:hypothetical protein